MSSQSDVSVLEQHKENIQPLSRGRPASKLAASFKRSNSSLLSFKEQLKRERTNLEVNISQADELDDPLQPFVEYIAWTHNNFPQGSNSESGLLTLLEKCTSMFRDFDQYKNDARYLNIWLEYTSYSDSPRDIFVYLAKKGIGNQLALYYEEFANYLEANGKIADATEIYEMGINSAARPLARLQRSFDNLKKRCNSPQPHSYVSPLKDVLALKHGPSSAGPLGTETSNPRKKQKLEVFREVPNQQPSVLESIFKDDNDVQELGTIRSRIKENVLQSKPWAGEVMRQKLTSESSESANRIQVYRDVHDTNTASEPLAQSLQVAEEDERGLVYTLIKNPGKRPEKVMFNMELLTYEDEEMSATEMLARSRRYISRRTEVAQTHEDTTSSHQSTPSKINKPLEDNQTFSIPLNDVSLPLNSRSRSPTITMFSRMANHEVMGMFNDAAQMLNSDDELENPEGENTTTTNYEGFVTETIQMNQLVEPMNMKKIEAVATPPTDREDNDIQSSPFIEKPSLGIINAEPINPVDSAIRTKLLQELSIPLSVYPGYHEDPDKTIQRLASFRDITNDNTKTISRGSSSSIIDYLGEEIYCLRHELGQGGFGFVYLIESGSSGSFKALKIESPSSKWEYYILNQIHRRLLGRDRETNALIIHPEAFFYFKDESYLIMDYCTQGTILDIVNLFKNTENSTIDEVLCIFLTVELLKSIEMLHSIGILHGDLKADNCMIRFQPVDHNEWSEAYSRYGHNGWSNKSITLIDFGRAIDLTLFDEEVQFKCDWETDQQDCPQMNENKPWSFEADYYGLATIIHVMLFGSYIKICKHNEKQIRLEGQLRRYWQKELWTPLFDLLLNPYESEVTEKRPLLKELRSQRGKLEQWLEENAKSKNLKNIILSSENDLNLLHKKRTI
ncbi:hypothetical protein G9P44_003940 [Scheffersomyces stipitis]|nr:hypothetical protein G9P44_003940 [Scheffersomyces stipitis]